MRPRPGDEARFLGRCGIKQLGAERTHENVAHVGVAADDVERVAPLRHGALPQHFAGHEKLRAVFGHAFFGEAHHENLAVHAGIHGAAEAVFRAAAEHVHKRRGSVDGVDVESVDLLPVFHAAGMAEKGRVEVQALDGPALFHEQPGGENTVQSPGKKSYAVIIFHDSLDRWYAARWQVFLLPPARPFANVPVLGRFPSGKGRFRTASRLS